MLRDEQKNQLIDGVVPDCYVRNVGSIGTDGQCKLLDSRVGVIGLGGLGGYVCEAMARLGVGKILGVDGDVFEATNLNRQIVSSTENLGQSKSEQTQLHIGRINPAVNFEAYDMRVESLSDEVLRECNVIFDCLDSISARKALMARTTANNIPLIHGAVAGWCGHVCICWPGSDRIEKTYAHCSHGIEEKVGTLIPAVAVAGNVMAAMAGQLLLGSITTKEKTPMLFFDLLAGQWETLEL